MKKFFTTVLVGAMMLLGSQAFAQVAVGGGYKMLTNKSGDNTATLNGAYVGADFSLPIAGGLALTPGAYFSYVTGSESASAFGGLVSGKGTVDEMYLTVPVRLSYSADLSSAIKGFVFAGPAFDYGLSSKTKLEGNVAGAVSAEKTTDNYDNDSYKRADVKVGGGVGLDILGVTRVTVGYDCGLLNRGTDNVELKSNQLYVGVSLLF